MVGLLILCFGTFFGLILICKYGGVLDFGDKKHPKRLDFFSDY